MLERFINNFIKIKMQSHLNKIISILVFLLFLSSCEKDELTLPTKVTFELGFQAFGFNENKNTESSFQKSQGIMQVTRGTITIESLEFDGRREEGKDFYFVSDFPEPITSNLSAGKTNELKTFDIPQGVYNFIEISLNLVTDNEAPIVIEGVFNRGMPFEDDILIRFEYPNTERIRIKAKPKGNGQNIVLKKDIPSTSTIKLDGGVIFQFVNMHMLINANISNFEGEEAIIINQNENNDIFNLMASQVERAFSAVIN